MKWNDNIRDNKNALLHSLNFRLGGLKKIASAACFKTRLAVANGIFMSKLTFMIPLWAGCSDYLVKALQVSQNNAARFVTRHGKSVSVKQLLKECGWRSVKQEIFYHSVLLVHKILLHQSPSYLHSQITADGNYQYGTRAASVSSIRQSQSFRTNLTLCKDSFRWSAVASYEQLPQNLREMENICAFKKNLNLWVKENISPM